MAVSIDGFQPAQIDHAALTVPSIHFSNAKNFMSIHNYHKAKASTYFVQMANTEHSNFSDVALLSPFLIGVATILGAADPNQVLRSLEQYTLAFLERELLQDLSSDPVVVAESDPDIDFRVRRSTQD